MGINIGSFTATLLCGWLGERYGWSYGFGAAGIGMIVGLITFTWGQKYLMGLAEPPDPGKLREPLLGPLNKEWAIYLLSLPVLLVLWLLVQHEHIVLMSQNILLTIAIVGLICYSMVHSRTGGKNGLAYAFAGVAILSGILAVIANLEPAAGLGEMSEITLYVAIALIVAFVVYGFVTHYSPEFGRTVALMVLILSTVVFWALFEQSAGSMTLYADRVVDRTVGPVTMTAAQFGFLNAFFIFLLAIPFAALWTWLSRKNMEPSTPVKFGLGIVQAGLGFGALVLGAQFPNAAGQVAVIWLVLAYLLHTTGELCLSPVGLSAVTKLSISSVVGVSMGTWFLATALSETVATRLGRLAAIPTDGGAATDLSGSLSNYTELFEFLMWTGIAT
jgi:POT family proton-dependent oligopeptide transporter